ncbi:hypothetical protein KR51_00024970, partial [Rubidibacter lacunae KORDI 51-2]
MMIWSAQLHFSLFPIGTIALAIPIAGPLADRVFEPLMSAPHGISARLGELFG